MLMEVICEHCNNDKSAFDLLSIFIAVFNKMIYRKCFVQLQTCAVAIFADAEQSTLKINILNGN
jgi:hypothetical protein